MSSSEEDEISVEAAPVVKVVKKKKKKKKKDPNAPKRGMSAFFLYSNANRSRVKEENPEAKFGDLAKLMSAEWKEVSGTDRDRWDQLAAEDKERYQREMETYEPPSDLEDSDSDSDSDAPKKKKEKKGAKKDPNAPKRAMTAYILYSNATRADVKAENPEAKFGDMARMISTNYKALPADERAYWDGKNAEEKERYAKQKASYDANGTF